MIKFTSVLMLVLPALCIANNQTEIKKFKHRQAVPSLKLADGYSGLDRIGMGESALRLEKTSVSYSNAQSTINLSQTISREDLAKDLNINISLSGGWGLFSSSASAAFLRHTEDTQFSQNFTFSERYYTLAILNIDALPASSDALSKTAADLYKREGMMGFAQRYGDRFIKEIPLGAHLVINMRLNFASALDKEKFNGKLKGGFGSIFNASATIQSNLSSSHAQGSLEIAAYQLGGDPSELPKIFAEKTSGGYYITTCSLDNLKDCQGTIDGIINYAQTNFNKQIKFKNNNEKTEANLVVVGEPLLESYAKKFRLRSPLPTDATTIKDRLEIASMYYSLKTTKQFFDHLQESPIKAYFTPSAHKNIKEMQFNLDWNWSLFDQFNAVQCFLPTGEESCKEIINNIKTYSKPIDEKIVRYFMDNGYYEIQADCTYSPVSMLDEVHEGALYAGMCGDHWVNGIYLLKMAGDKSYMVVQSDYMDQGYHMQASGTLNSTGTQSTYSGVARFHNLYTNVWFNHTISMRLTNNMI